MARLCAFLVQDWMYRGSKRVINRTSKVDINSIMAETDCIILTQVCQKDWLGGSSRPHTKTLCDVVEQHVLLSSLSRCKQKSKSEP
eukprot:scaffold37492_cov17-Tisochrysis_lutea.AAC.3